MIKLGTRNSFSCSGAVAAAAAAVVSRSPIGVSFSPAGLLSAFHMGASSELKRMQVITSTTTLSGASGGGLAAVISALDGISSQDSLAACTYIAERCRVEGTRKTLRLALDDCLDELIPSDGHTLLNQRAGRVIVAYREIYPTITPHFVDNFTSKEDLLDVLRATCNIP